MATVKHIVFIDVLRTYLSPCNKCSSILQPNKETKQIFHSRSLSNYMGKPKLKCSIFDQPIYIPHFKEQQSFLKKQNIIFVKWIIYIHQETWHYVKKSYFKLNNSWFIYFTNNFSFLWFPGFSYKRKCFHSAYPRKPHFLFGGYCSSFSKHLLRNNCIRHWVLGAYVYYFKGAHNLLRRQAYV